VREVVKLVWNVNLIGQVWLEDVFGVGFDLDLTCLTPLN